MRVVQFEVVMFYNTWNSRRRTKILKYQISCQTWHYFLMKKIINWKVIDFIRIKIKCWLAGNNGDLLSSCTSFSIEILSIPYPEYPEQHKNSNNVDQIWFFMNDEQSEYSFRSILENWYNVFCDCEIFIWVLLNLNPLRDKRLVIG